MRVGDHDTVRTLAPGLHCKVEPLDARLFQIAEVLDVVDVAVDIHVAPSHGDARHVHELARIVMRRVCSHGMMPKDGGVR